MGGWVGVGVYACVCVLVRTRVCVRVRLAVAEDKLDAGDGRLNKTSLLAPLKEALGL